MVYSVLNTLENDKDYKKVFNAVVITLNYSNSGIKPSKQEIKSDLNNAVFIDCFMANNVILTVEFKNKLINTLFDLNECQIDTLLTVLSVM